MVVFHCLLDIWCGPSLKVSIAESNSRGNSQPEVTFAPGSISQHLLRQ